MKINPMTIGVISLLVFIGGIVWWAKSNQTPAITDANTVSTKGLHVHPELEIYVKGTQIFIPENIGLSGVEMAIHTHEDLPIIHLEFPGTVTKDDIRLKKFFEVWGKDFYEFGATVTMTVNGVQNTELGNYIMNDKDKIVLRYE